MFYIAKFFQAAGLTVILINFLVKFPALMNPKFLIAGVLLFLIGWLINKFLIK